MSESESAPLATPETDRLVSRLKAIQALGVDLATGLRIDAGAFLREQHLLRGRVEHAAWQAGAIERLMDRLAERDGEIAALRGSAEGEGSKDDQFFDPNGPGRFTVPEAVSAFALMGAGALCVLVPIVLLRALGLPV